MLLWKGNKRGTISGIQTTSLYVFFVEIQDYRSIKRKYYEGNNVRDRIYEPGSWGPAKADELLARDGRGWNMWDGRVE
jgi:hypothetical protein